MQIVNQAKYDFLNNNDIENTIMIMSYTLPPGATLILFQPKVVEAISLQKKEIYFNHRKS